jgi:hypothetical protein
MGRRLLASALVSAAMAIAVPATALVPEVYRVTVEFIPAGGGAPVKATVECRRGEACQLPLELPIEGARRAALFSTRSPAGTLELLLSPAEPDPGSFMRISVRRGYEPGLTIESTAMRAALFAGECVERPIGQVRFLLGE